MDAIGTEEGRFLDLIDDVVDEQAVRLQPDAIDDRIGTDAAGHLHQRLVDRAFLKIDRLRAELLRKFEPMREVIDRDDAIRTHQHRRLDREQPDRAAAPDRDDVAGFDVRIFRTHPAGGQDVGQEQHLVVVDAVGDDDGAVVAERHADIFRLTARIAAGHVAVAEQPRHGMAVQLLRDILVIGGVAVVAARILMLVAVIALPARDRERDDDTLPLSSTSIWVRFRPLRP